MRNATTVIIIALLAVSSLAKAQNDMSPMWKEVGRWEIRVDTTLDYGCFAMVVDEGRVFRLGINNQNSTFIGFIGKAGWDSIEEGTEYPVDVEFDAQGAWGVPATGFHFGDFKTLGFEVSDSLFVEEMMERRVMYVRYKGEQIMKLSMQGSSRAVQELGVCMNAFDSDAKDNGDTQSDPFAASGDDPFAPNY
jgi:hypothetical protein